MPLLNQIYYLLLFVYAQIILIFLLREYVGGGRNLRFRYGGHILKLNSLFLSSCWFNLCDLATKFYLFLLLLVGVLSFLPFFVPACHFLQFFRHEK